MMMRKKLNQTFRAIETLKSLNNGADEAENVLKQTRKPLAFKDKLIFMRKRKWTG